MSPAVHEDIATLGALFVEITNRSKDGFFVIRETRFQDPREFSPRVFWYAKACKRDGQLVAIQDAQRLTTCELLLAKLKEQQP